MKMTSPPMAKRMCSGKAPRRGAAEVRPKAKEVRRLQGASTELRVVRRAPQAGGSRGCLTPLASSPDPLRELLYTIPLGSGYINAVWSCGPPSHSDPADPRLFERGGGRRWCSKCAKAHPGAVPAAAKAASNKADGTADKADDTADKA